MEQQTNRQIVIQSLEWRLKKLEDRLLTGSQEVNQQSMIERLTDIIKSYNSFINLNPELEKFAKLYSKHKMALEDFSSGPDESIDTKIDIILSYEEELVDYMNSSKKMALMANRVLDQNKWPDTTKYKEQLDKLSNITLDQQKQLKGITSATGDYLELYNDTIDAIKKKIVLWDQKLRFLEDRDKDTDEDKDVDQE